MADLTYQATLDDKISPALTKIQGQVKNTTAVFDKFRTALAGIAFGSLIQQAVAYADSIQDIADATDLAVESVIGFGKVVATSGGNVEKAQAAMVKFTLSLGDATNGSLSAQNAFAEVGITLQDLRTLSEQDLFNKTIIGLSKMTDVGERSRIQNELLGKSLKGVNLKDVAANYGAATEASKKYADGIREGAKLQDNLTEATSKLKLELLRVIAPAIEFFNKFTEGGNNATLMAQGLVAAMGLFVAGGIIVGINTVRNAIIGLAGAFGLTTAATAAESATLTANTAALVANNTLRAAGSAARIASLQVSIAEARATVASTVSTVELTAARTFLERTTWRLAAAQAALAESQAIVTAATATGAAAAVGAGAGLGAMALAFGKIALIAAAVVAAIIAINEAIKFAFKLDPIDAMATKLEKLVKEYLPALADGLNWLGQKLGMAAPPSERTSTAGAGRGGNADITAQLQAQGEEMRRQSELAKADLEIKRKVQDALEKQRKEIALISVEFKRGLDSKAEQVQLETDLIGKSERQKSLAEAINDLTKRTTEEVNKLTKARDTLGPDQKGLVSDYNAQIAAVKTLGEKEKERLTNLVEGLTKAKALEEFRLYGIKQQQDVEDKLLAIQRQMADLTLTDIEKGYRDIARAADDSAKAAIRAEEARRGEKLNDAEVEAYYKKARAGVESLTKAQQNLNKEARTFATGWKKAFADYVDNATDAAKAAERLFEKFTSGIEDLLVNFAKTGKFEWKNFVASMAEELLRSQIKQTLASVLQMPNPFSNSGGSVSDMFGGLFGGLLGGGGATKGQSANNPMYVYDVAGGGGIGGGFMGPQMPTQQGGGIMGTIGNIFTGVKDAVGSVFSGIGDAIGGVASSVGSIFSGGGSSSGGGFLDSIGSTIGDLFGGFFANGGNIPAGKFGMVGERGPEFIGGPASITPMAGAVTYNINAVDAASFQALVARDPAFIHSVAMAGARSTPQGRR